MQGTKVEGTIAKLFEGHTQNFVECINVDYKSSRRESYMDLQLVVKGCKTMYDSFDQLVEVEKLEGQNQYQAEQHGMQVTSASRVLCCTRNATVGNVLERVFEWQGLVVAGCAERHAL